MPAPEDRHRRARVGAARHTRAVRWMKILLPIGALVVIGAIFLMGRERATIFDADTAAQLATVSTGMRLDNPRFSGLTDEGDPFVITADWALPDGAMPNRITLENPVGNLRSGTQALTVTAETGELLREEERLHLGGQVVMESSDGYRIMTDRVDIDLAARSAIAPERLRAEGPRGNIEADRVQLVRGEADDDLTIRFEGHVQVNWQPESANAARPSDGG